MLETLLILYFLSQAGTDFLFREAGDVMRHFQIQAGFVRAVEMLIKETFLFKTSKFFSKFQTCFRIYGYFCTDVDLPQFITNLFIFIYSDCICCEVGFSFSKLHIKNHCFCPNKRSS